MYLFFAIADLFIGFARFFIVPDKGVIFHITGYLISVTFFIILWECILLSARKLESYLPIATFPYRRAIIQILITYVILAVPSFFIKNELSDMLRIIGYLFYLLVAVVMNLIYFGVIYFYNWKEDRINLANMQREQAIVKYDVLKNQLNPHFLFNALTSLNSLIFENQQLASDFLQQLSKVYRYVLQNKEKATVTLQTELDFITSFIFLLKTRFVHAVEFSIELGDNEKQKEVVPVTLQILIENAIKHNVVSKEQPLSIYIYADADFLFIQNSLNKKAQVETSNKQGLENLKSLYRYLTDRPVQIMENDSSFTVKIPLI